MARDFDFNTDIFSQLPQQGPGSDLMTERAIRLVEPLSDSAQILDIGCGAGRQTLCLARLTNAAITAVDLDVTAVAARFASAGLSDRLVPRVASMDDLPFGDAVFDGIWSEGAIYNMGFDSGLRAWRRLLVPNGFLAVTELSWLSDDRPGAAVDFWRNAYPGMGTRSDHLGEIEAAGYRAISDFPLGREAWWTDYYGPMDARLASLRKRFAGSADVLGQLEGLQSEIDLFRTHGESYDYVFYLCARDEA